VPTCSCCGRQTAVLLTHRVVYRGKVIEWTECRRCAADADERAQSSIAMARMAGA
jgi:hypothetical protein